MPKYKTLDCMRKAAKNYQSKFDNINCRMPKGTKDQIKAAAPDMSVNAFINEAITEKLERLNK